MAIHTILGAGGAIAGGLTKVLSAAGENIRLVSRNPSLSNMAEVFPADVFDKQQAIEAVKGSSVVYLCIGLKYEYAVWRALWPKIMDNTIEACRKAGAKMIFFDNVYMYGKVDGPMTEETPFNPVSKKGDLRARIATKLMSEVRKGNITASIARAADFYGPGADKTSVPNMLVFANLGKNKRAQWLANASVKHSFTYVPDACQAIYQLAKNDDSWNQTWHLPTAGNPLTGNEFIHEAAKAMQSRSAYTVLSPWMLRLAGIFNKNIAESYEMLYQSKYEYIFDSGKFNGIFDFQPTPYHDGIIQSADVFRKKSIGT